MPRLGGTKGELHIRPTTDGTESVTCSEKVIGGVAALASALAVYKGVEPSFHQPHEVDENWLGVGAVGFAAVGLYVQQVRKATGHSN